ncbi:COX15/CtaA family protein [Salinithrix halophila]|uniref:Heme A synthase n=1 Tax=Salinithrix halophila TaxID=1485204 RepID=A0ABV8JN03_9BACL
MKGLLRTLAVLATVGNFIILIQGALVTKTGSGDGCGNTWPFCHGEVFPTYHTLTLWIEYSHRIVSGLVGLLVVALAVGCWRFYRHHKRVRFFAFSSLFFIVLQGLLGAAAVVWSQSEAVMALHFGLSLMSFAAAALLTVVMFQLKKADEKGDRKKINSGVSRKLKTAIWGLAFYTYVVVYTGAFVRHTGSSLGCSTWPLCGDTWVPDLTTQAGIQWMHRLFAGLLFFLTLWLFLYVRKRYPARKDLYRGSLIAFLLTLAQVFTGGLIVLTKLELTIALMHTTLIAAFFAALCYLAMQVGVPWRSGPPLTRTRAGELTPGSE